TQRNRDAGDDVDGAKINLRADEEFRVGFANRQLPVGSETRTPRDEMRVRFPTQAPVEVTAHIARNIELRSLGDEARDGRIFKRIRVADTAEVHAVRAWSVEGPREQAAGGKIEV